MKKILTLLFFSVSLIANSQIALDVSRVDTVSKEVYKCTTWCTLNLTSKLTYSIRAARIDSSRFFDLRLMTDVYDHYSIRKNQKLVLHLDNDSTVSLENTNHSTACVGCGSIGDGGRGLFGVEGCYFVPADVVPVLINHKVKSIRIYTSEGFFDDKLEGHKMLMIQQGLWAVR